MSESKIGKQLVGALQRQLVRRAREPFDANFLQVCIMRAKEGKLHLTAMDDAEKYVARGESLDDGLAALAELFSSDRGQMLAVSTLDETFCGMGLVLAATERLADVTASLGHARSAPLYIGFAVCSLDMSELIMTYDTAASAAEVIDVNAGPEELASAEDLRAIIAGVWNIFTALDDSLAAPLPPNHEELTVELLLSAKLNPLMNAGRPVNGNALLEGLPTRADTESARMAEALGVRQQMRKP